MRITIIQDNGLNESMALMELAAWLEAQGHEFTLFLSEEERDLTQEVRTSRPEVLLVPTDVGSHHWAHRTTARLKQAFPDVPLVVGGTLATFFPEILEWPGVDYLLYGEAEIPMRGLLDALAEGREPEGIPNLWFLRDGQTVQGAPGSPLVNMEEIPLPKRELYYDRYPFLGKMVWKRFSASRGCIHSCTYCFNNLLNRKAVRGDDPAPKVRRKHPSQIVAEVREVAARWPTRSIHFSDDLFMSDKEWVREFCDAYQPLKHIGFTFNTTDDSLDEDVIRRVAEAGCRGIAIGVESGNEELRGQILGRWTTNKQLVATAQLVKRYRMQLTTFNMIGLPGETVENVWESIALNRALRPDNMRLNMAQVIPRTAFAKIGVRKGLVSEEVAADIMSYSDYPAAREETFFSNTQRTEFNNLLYLYRPLVWFPWLEKPLKPLLRYPVFQPFKVAVNLAIPYFEKRFFNISWREGLDYFRHTGTPQRRSKNIVSLI